MNIQSMLPDTRPRERLQSSGPSSLTTPELLAVILKSGTQKHNALELSQKLLKKYSLQQLPNISTQQLIKEHGIGPAKACQIVSLFEIYKRLPTPTIKKSIRKAVDIAKIYLPKYSNEKKEHFFAIYLDTKHNIIKDEIISIGTLNSSLVHPREVFHGAIKHCAHSIIIVHNHPSGNPQPSEEDIQVTNILKETGTIMGIPLIDHIILGNNSYWSWKESTNL